MQNLLRPEQRQAMNEERDTLQAKLANPHIQDKGAVVKQLRTIEHQIDTQTPKPFIGIELDKARKRADALKAKILEGMPSQEEMRKNPPGAVGKHRAWEAKNKAAIIEWKNLQLRINHNSQDPDVANFEKFRPTGSTLNMHGAQIPGQQYFFPSEQYKAGYENIDWNAGKSKPKPVKIPPKPKRKTINMSPEARKAASERMKAMHERKRLEKAAAAGAEG